MNEALIAKIHRLYSFIIDSQQTKINELESDFADFREKNCLDKYFAKNFSLETKKRVLGQIEELNKETEWG